MGILEGKSILVAGVTLDTSIGFHVAKIAQAEGRRSWCPTSAGP